MQNKICSKCGKTKLINEYQRCKGGKFGVRAECKLCHANYVHNQYIKNRDEILLKHKIWKKSHKNEIKNAQIKSKYGINLDQYNEMIKKQNGVCAICGNPELSKNKNLHIDHDHKTGKVRGLLCGKCNKMLGLIDDKIETLIKSINYLKG